MKLLHSFLLNIGLIVLFGVLLSLSAAWQGYEKTVLMGLAILIANTIQPPSRWDSDSADDPDE